MNKSWTIYVTDYTTPAWHQSKGKKPSRRMLRIRRIEFAHTVILLAVLTCMCGQPYQQRTEMNLCEKRPGVEPNGEHLSEPGEHLLVYVSWTITDHQVSHHCLMRFSTCRPCRLRVQAVTSFSYSHCSSPLLHSAYDGHCVPGCTYLHLFDQDYSTQVSASYTSSINSTHMLNLDFRTQSRFLYVVACSNRTRQSHVFFKINITAEHKMQYFHVGSPQFFSSPLFPHGYALNSEVYKYDFRAVSLDDFIVITFDDWHLSKYSSITFDRANIKGKIWGSTQRPWIVSDGGHLVMTFDTGRYIIPGTFRAYLGFSATCSFHSGGRYQISHVHTNCGGWIERQESGNISMSSKPSRHEYYDCIWVIKKHPGYQKIMVKIITYTRTDLYSSPVDKANFVEIRNGLTSQGLLVQRAVPDTSLNNVQTFADHESDTGFYVRLKGQYTRQKDFVLVYTAFNWGICTDLLRCGNGRCVPSSVAYDGVDNCGDNTDETDHRCCGAISPSASSYPSPSNASTIIISVISSSMVVIIIVVIVFVWRRHLSRQLQRARDDRNQGRNVDGHDPPPSYEEVVSNTPIGYLQLSMTDGYPTPAPLQPPSYDDAVRGTTMETSFSQEDG